MISVYHSFGISRLFKKSAVSEPENAPIVLETQNKHWSRPYLRNQNNLNVSNISNNTAISNVSGMNDTNIANESLKVNSDEDSKVDPNANFKENQDMSPKEICVTNLNENPADQIERKLLDLIFRIDDARQQIRVARENERNVFNDYDAFRREYESQPKKIIAFYDRLVKDRRAGWKSKSKTMKNLASERKKRHSINASHRKSISHENSAKHRVEQITSRSKLNNHDESKKHIHKFRNKSNGRCNKLILS